jgi:ring-1,2-phenylacetyl-CoA epoxidase subunit PaaE
LDQEKLLALLRNVVGNVEIDHAYVCGPFGMIAGVEAALAGVGVPADRVHVERFSSALNGRPRAPRPVQADAPPSAVAVVTVQGARTEVPVAEGETVLDASLRAGLDLPFACKGGMCSTCRAKVVDGSVEMEVNYALEPWEVEAGFVLTCQARPTSGCVVIDYDQQ